MQLLRARVTRRCNGAIHPLAQMGHYIDCFFAASPLSNLERVVEDGEIFSPSRDHHILEMPHSSPPPSEHVSDKPQPSSARTEQVYDEMPQSSPQA